MRSSDEVLRQLHGVRELLIAPDSAALKTSQLKLADAISFLSQAPKAPVSAEIREAVNLIRFLLDKARDFWLARQSGITPNHYSFGGVTIPVASVPTFAMEV